MGSGSAEDTKKSEDDASTGIPKTGQRHKPDTEKQDTHVDEKWEYDATYSDAT